MIDGEPIQSCETDEIPKRRVNLSIIFGIILFVIGISLIVFSIILEIIEIKSQIAQFGFYKTDLFVSITRYCLIRLFGPSGVIVSCLGVYLILDN